jgi:hypothetical protein
VTSSSYTILTSLLPFLLLLGFWMHLMRNSRGKQAAMPSEQQQILAKLEEIRAEVERLRRATAERDSDGFGFRS